MDKWRKYILSYELGDIHGDIVTVNKKSFVNPIRVEAVGIPNDEKSLGDPVVIPRPTFDKFVIDLLVEIHHDENSISSIITEAPLRLSKMILGVEEIDVWNLIEKVSAYNRELKWKFSNLSIQKGRKGMYRVHRYGTWR